MAKSMRSVLRLPLAVRSLSTLQSRSVSLRLFRTSSSARTIDDRGASLQMSDRSAELRVTFSDTIAECRTPEELLSLVREDEPQLTGSKAVRCLQALAGMVEAHPDVAQTEELCILCDKLKEDIHQLPPMDMIRALKSLHALQVPATDVTTQLLLQQLRNCVRQLSLNQITATKQLLQKYEKTLQVDALSMVLAVASENHLNKQYNKKHLDELISVLNYNKEAGNAAEISSILREIQKLDDASCTLDQAKNLLFLLVDLEPDDTILELIPRLQDIVARDMSSLNTRELKVLLLKTSPKGTLMRKTRNHYYHEALYDACADAVVSSDLGFGAAVDVLYYLYLMDHVNVDLLDYIAWQCLEDPDALRNAPEHQVERFVAGLSMADYRPASWDTIKSYLMKTKIDDYDPAKLTKFAVHLATLGCHWPELIARVFTSQRARRRYYNKEYKHLLLLYHAVRRSVPEYRGPWPSKELLRSCEKFPMAEKGGLKMLAMVEAAVGGPPGVLTNLRTKFSYYIDYAVAVRDGLPVAINDGSAAISRVEDVKPPENSKMFLFMNVPQYGYTRNTRRLIGLFSFVMKQIEEDTGHTVVPVHPPAWSLMSSDNQVKHIREVIGLRCEPGQLPQLQRPPEAASKTQVSERVRACRTPEEVLALVHGEVRQLTGHDAVKCLLALFDMDKKSSDLKQHLLLRGEFTVLCETLRKHVNELSETEALHGLKCLTHFNVRTKGSTVKAVLQRLRAAIDQLVLDDVIFLKFLLSKHKKTAQVNELDDQLSTAFKTEVNRQLDTRSLTALVKTLDFIMNKEICTDVIPEVLCAIERFEELAYTPQHAKNLLIYLMDLEPNESVANLIPRLQAVVARSMDDYTEKELDVILLKMSAGSRTQSSYYHEGLLDGVAATVVSRNLGPARALRVLHQLNSMNHVNTELLDYVATKCLEDPKLLQKAVGVVHLLTKSLANAGYKPANWDRLKHLLMDERILNFEVRKLLEIGLRLATLDCYWPELLAKVFAAEPQTVHPTYVQRLLLLYRAVRNSYSRYRGPWPSDEFLRRCESCATGEAELRLRPAVEAAVGGPQYVLSGLRTKLCHDVDHAVIMRKGGFPIAINCGTDRIDAVEDIKPPQDSQVILLVSVPVGGYVRNTRCLTGFFSFLVKQMELETRHTVIPVDSTICETMSEREQIKHISEVIRHRCDALSAVVN